jgi:hypothetical protein
MNKNFQPIGYPSEGIAFNDWDYFVSHETSEHYYRLIGVQLCGDNDGNLNGMEAFVGRYSAASNNLLSTLSMNNIGNVNGICKTLQVDPTRGQFINSITVRYGVGLIDAISIGASTGQRIFLGNFPAEYTETELIFTETAPLVGFFGTASIEKIYSLGQVVVDTNCTVAVDPFVTPVENINKS